MRVAFRPKRQGPSNARHSRHPMSFVTAGLADGYTPGQAPERVLQRGGADELSFPPRLGLPLRYGVQVLLKNGLMSSTSCRLIVPLAFKSKRTL